MVSLEIRSLGKKFSNEWIFRNLDMKVDHSGSVAITGSNGSGKSTLLQIMLGFVSPTEGSVQLIADNTEVPPDQYYRHVSFAAPYLDLVDEFSLAENVRMFSDAREFSNNMSSTDVIAETGLEEHADKLIRDFSSGMKQRVRLTLAFTTNSSLLLLDEPLSNLDQEGFRWYEAMFNRYSSGRICVICSNNIKEEIRDCKDLVNIADFK